MTYNIGSFKKGHVPWNKNTIKRTCLTCGNVFEISQYRRGIAKFCSHGCYNKAKLGKSYEKMYGKEGAEELIRRIILSRKWYKHSEKTKKKIVEIRRKNGSYVMSDEHKKKLLLINIGKKHTKETRRKISINNARYWKGKTFCMNEKTKKKIGLAHKGRKLSVDHVRKMSISSKGQHRSPSTEFKSGKHHPRHNFKGYPSGYGYGFRMIIKQSLEFYNYKCVECGVSNEEHIQRHKKRLLIHHKDGNKKNNTIENCVPVCVNCHSKQWVHYHKDFEILPINKFIGGYYEKNIASDTAIVGDTTGFGSRK